jgi:UDP:flavonoid glycosyltransferase YjiC (YdhE family)
MKILIASTPATGHLNPMLAIARILMIDEVAIYTGSAFRARVEAAGAKFFSLPPEADLDLTDPFARFPELKVLPPGLEWLRVGMERIFVDNIPA